MLPPNLEGDVEGIITQKEKNLALNKINKTVPGM